LHTICIGSLSLSLSVSHFFLMQRTSALLSTTGRGGRLLLTELKKNFFAAAMKPVTKPLTTTTATATRLLAPAAACHRAYHGHPHRPHALVAPPRASSFAARRVGLANNNRSVASAAGNLEEVEWSAENTNSVTLIGRLGREPEVKYLEDGKVVASVTLAVNRGKNASPHWFDLDFWNDEARLVESLQKGQQVQVQGRLNHSSWVDRATQQNRSKVSVTCNKVALVAGGAAQGSGSFGGGGSWQQQGGGGGGGYAASANQQGGGSSWNGGGRSSFGGGSVQSKDIEGRWAALFCSPDDFWDNRATKRNPKAPDFKHKETGEALWVESRSTPSWVASSLKELDLNVGVDPKTLFNGPGMMGDGAQNQNQKQGGQQEIPF